MKNMSHGAGITFFTKTSSRNVTRRGSTKNLESGFFPEVQKIIEPPNFHFPKANHMVHGTGRRRKKPELLNLAISLLVVGYFLDRGTEAEGAWQQGFQVVHLRRQRTSLGPIYFQQANRVDLGQDVIFNLANAPTGECRNFSEFSWCQVSSTNWFSSLPDFPTTTGYLCMWIYIFLATVSIAPLIPRKENKTITSLLHLHFISF